MTEPNSTEFNKAQCSRAVTELATHLVTFLAMPEYVDHYEGASEIWKLSAEAVVGEYEQAAYDIEVLGAQLVNASKNVKP